jgi:O6-methylguanine-DNA--protein-cysteine methyltransferase
MFEWTGIKLLDDLDLLLVASASGIRTIQFDLHPIPEWQRNDRNPLLMEAASQLRAYFAGQLHEFQLPLDVDGTGFQKRVWGQVAAIPYGETRSYLKISTAL